MFPLFLQHPERLVLDPNGPFIIRNWIKVIKMFSNAYTLRLKKTGGENF